MEEVIVSSDGEFVQRRFPLPTQGSPHEHEKQSSMEKEEAVAAAGASDGWVLLGDAEEEPGSWC